MSDRRQPADAPAPRTPERRRNGPRAQPPLQEVLQGLDSRELEGQTVFDQLFGPPPEGAPAPPPAKKPR